MKRLSKFTSKEIDFSLSCGLRGGTGSTCTDVEETVSACDSDYVHTTFDDEGNEIGTCYEGGCENDFPKEERCPELNIM